MTLNSNSKSHFTYHLLVILITIVIITTITMHTNKQLSLLHGEKRTASIVTGCSFILVCQDKEKKNAIMKRASYCAGWHCLFVLYYILWSMDVDGVQCIHDIQ